MFNVGNNLLAPPLAGFPGTLSAGSLPGSGYASATASGDGISQAAQPQTSASSLVPWWGGGNSAGGFIAQFMSTIFGALSQMAQYFTSMFGTPPWNGSPAPFPSPYPAPGSPGPTPDSNGTSNGQASNNAGGAGMPEQFFSSASAASSGDPHDAFNGTTGSGQTIGEKWDSMISHPNLLVSDSFKGGFRISTTAGDPNAHGVTHNDAATVETNDGKTTITMNGDGSYQITDGGKSIALHAGQTKNLGNGESVTLNADNSLTIVEKNDTGGEITTTLTGKNGHVNVEAEAQNVDLGGFLVRHAEKHGTSGGTAGSPQNLPGLPGSAFTPSVGQPPLANYQPFQPYQPPSYQPYSGAEQSFDALLGA